MLRRLNVLLVDLDSYEEHFDRVARLCEIGQKAYPETFTAEAVRVAKAKVNLMRNAFYTIADADGGIPPNRDHPDVGSTLMESFIANFEQDYNPELFSPGPRDRRGLRRAVALLRSADSEYLAEVDSGRG